jgi:hypothetical protein
MRTEWMQGYVDWLNDRINVHAYEESKEYKDGFTTAAKAERDFTRQQQGERNEF